MQQFILSILFLSLSGTALSQTFPAENNATPEKFSGFLLSNQQIAANDTLNELLLDLVNPIVSDSIVKRKKQHHKVGGFGIFAHLFGYNWRAFDLQKQKMCGTVVRAPRSSEEQFSEYDINFDLIFHQRKYLHYMFSMYDQQKVYNRQDIRKDHRTDYDTTPFVRDTNVINLRDYQLHCELTPDSKYRDSLNKYFFPTRRGAGGLKDHSNFQDKHPSAGFYGLLCSDCNHNCKPEMHPYEWMWWMKLNDNDQSSSKEWNVGLFHEGSNRQKNWSKNPKTGSIRIPFAFVVTDDSKIRVEHRVHGEFDQKHLKQLHIPSTAFSSRQKFRTIQLPDQSINLQLEFNEVIDSEALQYWFEQLNYDTSTSVLSGYFCFAVAVKDLYTCKIVFP